MIKTWQQRCQDFDDQRVISHQDIQNKMQEEIDELRTAYRGLATQLGKLRKAQSNCNGFCGAYECKENQNNCKRKAQSQ